MVGIIGVTCAKIGLIDKNALSVMSKLIFGLFQPCLLFVNIVTTIAKLQSGGTAVTVLTAAAFIQILMGWLFGTIMSYFCTKRGSDEERQMKTCITFGNAGPLPLVFVDALLKSHSNSALLPQSVGYVSLYLLGWSPLFWIIAPQMLTPPSSNSSFDVWLLLKRVFSPPVLGSIFGLIVGSVPSLRDTFMSPTGILNPFFEGMRTLGAGYLPCVLMVLAGSLLPAAPDANAPPSEDSSDSDSLSFFKQIAGIYLSRFLILPIVAKFILGYASDIPSISAALKDPVLLLVLLLETCMPPAQNTTVILQLLGNRVGAAKIARVLMAIYILGVPMITYWIGKILELTNLAT